MQLLQDNKEENLDDFGFGDDFLDTAKTLSIKEKIDKLDFFKIKMCSAKGTVERMKV